MIQKRIIRLSIGILVLALVSACGTNNNNDGLPQDPENENDIRYHNGDTDIPDNDENYDREQEPGVDNNNDGDVGVPEREISLNINQDPYIING